MPFYNSSNGRIKLSVVFQKNEICSRLTPSCEEKLVQNLNIWEQIYSFK
jgi:hypothetical protein